MEKLSNVGNNIVGSEIIKISQQIKEIAKTKSVSNLTIGDFNSELWPIPPKLKQHIEQCYEDGLTNYPNSSLLDVMLALLSSFHTTPPSPALCW